MRISLSGTKTVLEHPEYTHFEEVVAAAGALIVSKSKGGDTKHIDIQVNTILLDRPAGQYAFQVGDAFKEAPAGRSDLTVEIDHVDKLRIDYDDNLLAFMVGAAATTLLGTELTKNVNCWSKQYGSRVTGWHEGSVYPLYAKWATEAIQDFINGSKSNEGALNICVRSCGVAKKELAKEQ